MDFGQILDSKSYDQLCKYSSMQVCKYASMQICTYASMHIYTSMLVCKLLIYASNASIASMQVF